ncbi:MAG TPA: hypothetical protein VHL30_04010 [Chlamydiales bacterium]|jgi:hypothetical protein|nr:hypothetical protein [Chlamydiales bacterium]
MLMVNKEKAKKIGVWLLAIFLLATHLLIRSTAQAAEPDSWKQFYTRGGECRISFPSVPKMIQQALTVTEEGDKLTYDVYLAPLNEKALCLLLVAAYPFPLKSGHELLGIEGLLNGIVGHHPDNKLIFANVINQKGNQAVDFLVQSPSSYFRGQAMMKGHKLYLLAIEGKKEDFNEEAFKKFAESFSLVP